MPQDALRKVVGGQSLTREEARQAITAVMDGLATQAQIGALLVALRMKGETVEEVTGCVQAMRARVVPGTLTPRTVAGYLRYGWQHISGL